MAWGGLQTFLWCTAGTLFIQCTWAATNCTTFIEVPEDEYEMNYATIGTAGRRPYGYISEIVRFGSDTQPCLSVTGETGQALEIKFETVPSATLCLKDLETNNIRCSQGRLSECVGLKEATQRFTFLCPVSMGCSESDVTFWVRLTKGPTYSEDPEMMWCEERREEYPEKLASLPPGFNPLPPSPPVGAAVACAYSITLAVICNIFLLLCSRYMGHY